LAGLPNRRSAAGVRGATARRGATATPPQRRRRGGARAGASPGASPGAARPTAPSPGASPDGVAERPSIVATPPSAQAFLSLLFLSKYGQRNVPLRTFWGVFGANIVD